MKSISLGLLQLREDYGIMEKKKIINRKKLCFDMTITFQSSQ